MIYAIARAYNYMVTLETGDLLEGEGCVSHKWVEGRDHERDQERETNGLHQAALGKIIP